MAKISIADGFGKITESYGMDQADEAAPNVVRYIKSEKYIEKRESLWEQEELSRAAFILTTART